mmetsp:Transcript_67178/g.60304  ORF Transcript_67178/g.60304 Transcript_67178/m.60304 type:complete len:272 (+) Transcript_67178:44-859(+)
MAQPLQPGSQTNEEAKQSVGDYKGVFRQASDSLYLMMRNTKTKRCFNNTFSKKTLIEGKDIKQPISELVNLLTIAKSGQKAGFTFDIRFGDAENIKNVSMNELSQSYKKGDALYIFLSAKLDYFSAEYQFKLLEQQRSEDDILREVVEDMQQEIDSLKKMQPKRVSFNGRDGVKQNKECQIYNSFGISKVIRESTGVYVVYFEEPMANNNYIITCSANLWYTNGVFAGLEGNNKENDRAYKQKKECCRIGTRCPRANANRDSDLINVIIYP